MGRRRAQTPAEVEALRARIEDWRRTRRRRSPMPAELWGAAGALAKVHGVAVVARGLRLDYRSVKCVAVEGTGTTMPAQNRLADFAELVPFVGSPGLVTTVLELANARGERLTVHLGGRSEIDVLGMVEAFWRQGA